METTHCLHRHGFIILFLVLFVSSASGINSKINGSYNARDIKLHSDRKLVLSSSDSGGSPPPSTQCQYKPGPQKMFIIFCSEGEEIREIKFADYGQPIGDCDKLKFKRGNCGASATFRLVKKNCLGKKECFFPITDEMFGPTHCKGPISFAVLYTCAEKK